MTRKLRRILSIVLSLSMVLGLWHYQAKADNNAIPADLIKVELAEEAKLPEIGVKLPEKLFQAAEAVSAEQPADELPVVPVQEETDEPEAEEPVLPEVKEEVPEVKEEEVLVTTLPEINAEAAEAAEAAAPAPAEVKEEPVQPEAVKEAPAVQPAPAEPIAVTPSVPAQKVFTKEVNEAFVRAEVGEGAFDEEVELYVRVLEKGSAAWNEAKAALLAKGYSFDGMLAYDIGFSSKATGAEIEPKTAVSVQLEVKQSSLPASVRKASIAVSHISGNMVEKVADNVSLAGAKMTAAFRVDSFSTFTVTWDDGEATVIWGSYDANGEFQEIESTTSIDTSAASVDLNVAMADYYFVGVDYLETEDAEPVAVETSVLKKADDGSWTLGEIAVADGSIIRVNYAEKGSGGYTPPEKPTDDVLAPGTEKTVTKNEDGTFTIQLDIEGKSDHSTSQTAANVVVIMDITQSMTNNMPGGGGSRMAAAKQALTTLLDTLQPSTNKIYFTAVNFGNSADYSNGVNWTDVESEMRSYVTGLPNSPSDLGTCWQAGLQGGIDRVGTAPEGNETYVLFVTDGNPNGWVNAQGRYQQQGSGQFVQAAYNAAVPNANTLAGICHLYGIFVGDADGYDHLEDLINEAGGDDVINGSTTSAVEEAFANIAQTIVNNLGVGNTVVDDGVPSLSNVSANVTGGEAGGFEYYITPVGGEMTEWEDAPGASYDQSNGVTWDLGEAGELENGVIYTLKFTVWPSQEAYDLIADLNNGLVTMTPEELEAAGIEENDGVYTLKTNTHLYTTFTDLEGNEYREEYDAKSEAMDLPTETIGVEKVWNNLIDQQNPPAGVTLILTRDGEEYLSGDNAIEVSSGTDWKVDDIYISLGQITQKADNSYTIIETGHDYEIVESADYSGNYRWELTSQVYHPMVINGTATMLVKDEEATGTDGVDYYTINGVKYVVLDGENMLKAWNDRRSWLQIEKTVTGEGAPEDALFEFKVTIEEANGDDVWYSAYGPDGIVKDLETDGTAEDGNTGYFYVASGTPVSVKIQAGWTLRFLNLPSETTYEIEEVNLPDGFHFVEATSKYVKEANDENYKEDPEEPEISDMVVSGTINVPNTEFYAFYENEYAEVDIEITKEWDDNDDLGNIRPDTEAFAEYLSLLIGGEATEDYDDNLEIVDNEDGTYTITYKGLPKYIDNEEVEYTVEESQVEGYEEPDGSPAEDGDTITNTLKTADLTITKTVEVPDGFEVDADKEFTFTIKVTSNGKAVDLSKLSDDLEEGDEEGTYTFTLKDGDELTIEGIPVGAEWEITEDEEDGYETEAEGDTGTISDEEENKAEFTNTYSVEPATAEITVIKNLPALEGFEGWNDLTGMFTFELTAEGDAPLPETTSYTNPKADGGTMTFGEITFDTPGTYTYTVTETGDVKGIINDDETEKTVKITVEDKGDGTLEVTVDPEEVEFTNTMEVIELTVTKIWDDNDDQDGKRPEKITVTLYANGEAVGDPVVLTADNKDEDGNWIYTFTNLPSAKNGEDVEYTVKEDDIEGYEADYDDEELVITNIHEIEKVQVEVTKVWDKEEGNTDFRPEKISVTLYADGEKVESVELSEDNEWSYTWEYLDRYADGEQIEYTVEEDEAVPAYSSETETETDDESGNVTVTITNSLVTPAEDDPPVLKILEGDTPETDETFTFELKAVSNTAGLDEMPMPEGADGDTITVEAPEGVETEFGYLYFYLEGTYVYEISEKDTGAEGYTYDTTVYTVTYEVTQEGSEMKSVRTVEADGEVVDIAVFEFTNEYTAPTIDIDVTKVWESEEDADKTRPESITVKLLANGEETGDTLELSEDNDWSGTFEGVPSQKDGEEIEYSVEEEEVEYYTAEYEGDAENGFTITNICTYEPTGDDSHIFLWAAALMASVAGIGFTLFIKKRKEEPEK